MSDTRGVATRASAADPRRGLILLVVLVMIALLSLLAASYTFMVRANLNAAVAYHDQYQARMAAESGVQAAVTVLRNAGSDPGAWYNSPERFKAIVVAGAPKDMDLGQKNTNTSDQYDPNAPQAWRYNVVAPNYDDPSTVRYGLTDECSKLDLNRATESQLTRLFEMVIPQDTTNPVDIKVLVDSLLDWRDPSPAPRANGAKDEYYGSLDPPYRCKGAPFSTIEELLLVRGYSAWVVFGEDYNRNGLLDPNEDDGDASFPPDNADGALFAGVAPYFTLWTRERNVSKDNRARINLNLKDAQKLQEAMSKEFQPNIVSYVMEVRGAGQAFNSVMNLLPAPPPPKEEEEEPTTSQPATSQPGEATSQPGEGDTSTTEPTSQPELGLSKGLRKSSSDLHQAQGASEKKPKAKLPVFKNLTATVPPGTYEDLPLILDRLTVQPTPMFMGRINVSTAPRPVLAMIEELTDEELEAIVAARRELTPEERATPAWLLTRSVVDENKFRRILDKLATSSSVFRVESVGYADHVGVVERINVVLEMRGPVPQVLYQRNLGSLGVAYRPHGDEFRGVRERTP
jgi:type II secretory pathway component PulK